MVFLERIHERFLWIFWRFFFSRICRGSPKIILDYFLRYFLKCFCRKILRHWEEFQEGFLIESMEYLLRMFMQSFLEESWQNSIGHRTRIPSKNLGIIIQFLQQLLEEVLTKSLKSNIQMDLRKILVKNLVRNFYRIFVMKFFHKFPGEILG